MAQLHRFRLRTVDDDEDDDFFMLVVLDDDILDLRLMTDYYILLNSLNELRSVTFARSSSHSQVTRRKLIL